MFHINYIRLKELKAQLIAKFEKEEKAINQDVLIRDIFVYPLKVVHSYGESKNHLNRYQEHPTIMRLVDHVESLAKIANQYHQKYYCNKNEDGTYTIKKDCLNKITRILLNEFSLYSSKPLSMSDFSLFMEAVHEIAKNQKQNVHLLLSSLSVITDDNQILNVSLYVQCGREPKIETFCKGRSSDFDVTYEGTSNFSQEDIETSVESSKISEYVASHDGKVISNNTVFSVKTAGGAEYTQAIDVCLDHAHRHSKELVKRVGDVQISNNTKIIPNQVDHIVTSNSIYVWEGSKITESVVHIDPCIDQAIHMEDDIMTVSDLENSKKNKYSCMSIKKSLNGYVVRNPAFGSSYSVVATEERKLGGFSGDLTPIMNNRNNKVKEQVVESRLSTSWPIYATVVDQKKTAVDKLNALYKSLFDKCIPGFLEELFNTQSYKLKLQTQRVLKESMDRLRVLNKDSVSFMHYIDISLNDLKLQLKHLNHGIPNHFSNKLISKIDDAMTHVQSIKLNPGVRN